MDSRLSTQRNVGLGLVPSRGRGGRSAVVVPSGVSPFSSSQVVFARPWRFQRIRESRKRRGRPKFRTWSVPAPAGLSDRYENEWIPSRRRVPAFRRSKAGPVPGVVVRLYRPAESRGRIRARPPYNMQERRRVPAFRRSKAGPVPRYGAGIQGKCKTAIQYARTRRSTIFITQCGLRRAVSFLDRPLSPKRIYRMSEAPWKMNDR